MSRFATSLSRTRVRIVLGLLVLGLAGGATYAAGSLGRTSHGSGTKKIVVIHHATGAPAKAPTKVGAGTADDAIANVLDVDVKIGEFHSDYLTYKGISSDKLAQYSAAFDASQSTVVATAGGRSFYVCARSGKWYAEQHGIHKPVTATLTPGPLCKL
jgi:hypothetical protein